MNEQFDKALRDHIKDTFDVYNDQMADDGWKKYQRKTRRKRFLLFLKYSTPPAIAASLALFWLFYTGAPEIVPATTSKTAISASQPSNPVVSSGSAETAKQPFSATTNHSRSRNLALAPSNKMFSPVSEKDIVNRHELTAVKHIETLGAKVVVSENNLPSLALKEPDFEWASDFTKNSENVYAAEKEKAGPNPVFSDDNFLASVQSAYSDVPENELQSTLPLKKFQIALDASSFMNFSEQGINKDVNVAVGVISELRISKNLSINAGLNVNRQSSAFIASTETVESDAKNTMSFKSMAAPIISTSSSDAKLVGIDVPISVKYASQIGRHTSWFVSTGFSSSTLLNESYFNNISIVNYSLTGTQTTNETVKEEDHKAIFSNLQFARTLNFSVGIQLPVRNVTSLSVEPFIKYPLKGFGRENLAIGSSGVSLKLNLTGKLFHQ